MIGKPMSFSNFPRNITTRSTCFRPETIHHLMLLKGQSYLGRGQGLSYNDSCLYDQGIIIDTSRFNHLLAFDKNNGLLVTEGGVSFNDLLCIDNDYIPPVIPGTLHATLAGGIAHDIHGKNNIHEKTLGHHIEWIELWINNELVQCSPTKQPELFYATIGGLGLTGIIHRVALKMKKSSRYLEVSKTPCDTWEYLLKTMSASLRTSDYTVAWLDLISPERAILYHAREIETRHIRESSFCLKIPHLPFRSLYKHHVKWLNHFYFKQALKGNTYQTLQHFNNPLDKIKGWPYLYGPCGFKQFQAVFPSDAALLIIKDCYNIITKNKAIPTLAVLKQFMHAGNGLLSFVQPGISIAIDFIATPSTIQTIQQLNTLITNAGGKVYLAKDIHLGKEAFFKQYTAVDIFKNCLKTYRCTIKSNTSYRLGIHT